ncbi:MAG: hypothetical protein DHS20C12_27890 [Pseudohongiella sp.]|nr:MAG: hypothetical protein DHS20C12_27890 [Pseudohongiella sp.]
MQRVYENENLSLVYSAKNLLELEEIPCFLKNEHHGSTGQVGLSIPIELWIHDEAHAEHAMQLIEQSLTATEKASWKCPKCTEENDGSFDSCWKCQTNCPAL